MTESTDALPLCTSKNIATLDKASARAPFNDRLGRQIGAAYVVQEIEYVPVPHGQTWGCRRQPGRSFLLNLQPLRDGERYQAYRQSEFATREEARAKGEAYLAQLPKAAAKVKGAVAIQA